MATITQIGEEFPVLGSWDSETRPEGAHVTSLIYKLGAEAGLTKPSYDDDPELVNWFIEAGFRWEDTLALCYRGKIAPRPEPICVDGIWMSPDGLWEDGRGAQGTNCVAEYKWTTRGKRAWDEAVEDGTLATSPNWWAWMCQVKAYCWGTESLSVVFYVMFALGDYTRPFKPCPAKPLRIDWEVEELEENWEMILREVDRGSP